MLLGGKIKARQLERATLKNSEGILPTWGVQLLRIRILELMEAPQQSFVSIAFVAKATFPQSASRRK